MFTLNGQSSPRRESLSRVNDGFELEEGLNYDLAPPSYDEVINSTRFPIVRTGTRAGHELGYSFKLDFVDITPHLVQGSSMRQVGNFKTLLKRANTWLQSNPEVEIKTCETITWMSTSQSQVSETNAVHRSKSLSAAVKTKYMRGLRIWFVPHNASGSRSARGADEENSATVRINVEEISPTKCDETITGLVKKANNLLQYKGIAGKIINIETVLARSKPGKIYASHTYWTENSTKEKQHCFFLRIFYIQVDGPVQPAVIGIKDFLPSQAADSYDNFSQVTDKASCWISSQTDIKVVSLQSIFVKRKGTPEASHNRCFFTEHPLKLDSRITYYYQILRVGYVMKEGEVSLRVVDPPTIAKKTFAPAMMPPLQDEQENRFEPFTKTVERVSSWLDSTGAEVFGVETVPVRMNTGAQQRYGPEASLVWSQPEPGIKFEDWLLFVRVYVQGDYQEPRMQPQYALSMPPVDWHRRLRDAVVPLQQTARSRRKRNCIIFCILFLLIVIAAFVIMYVSYSFVNVKEQEKETQ